MKRYSVVVRAEYTIELEAEDPESAEAEAEMLFRRGSIRRFQSGDIDSVQADEMG
jgi:hypothetical protein